MESAESWNHVHPKETCIKKKKKKHINFQQYWEKYLKERWKIKKIVIILQVNFSPFLYDITAMSDIKDCKSINLLYKCWLVIDL